MTSQNLQPTYLKNYTPPDFQIEKTHLHFDIQDEHTIVTSILHMKRFKKDAPLVLDGDELILEKLFINGKEIAAGEAVKKGSKIERRIRPTPDAISRRYSCQCFAEEIISLTHFPIICRVSPAAGIDFAPCSRFVCRLTLRRFTVAAWAPRAAFARCCVSGSAPLARLFFQALEIITICVE